MSSRHSVWLSGPGNVGHHSVVKVHRWPGDCGWLDMASGQLASTQAPAGGQTASWVLKKGVFTKPSLQRVRHNPPSKDSSQKPGALRKVSKNHCPRVADDPYFQARAIKNNFTREMKRIYQ